MILKRARKLLIRREMSFLELPKNVQSPDCKGFKWVESGVGTFSCVTNMTYVIVKVYTCQANSRGFEGVLA